MEARSDRYLARPDLPIVTVFDYDESETESNHGEDSDTDDTFSVEELESAVFAELDDGEHLSTNNMRKI